ncbi:hypothetical protein [Sporosarcina sp. ZBG7A]|uniref:hypothetical protein n=1 Tax=Sporosarcina sp. ZBG7A TaxID=1582223 RepID=UPI00057A2CD3|nr:hypothetical protein [Sporosarcina sp. ZBG7A]
MRYAQILHNKVHWIFESEEKPQFAPNIVLVDITDKPDVQEGWDYDEVTGVFTQPIPIEPEPLEPTELEVISNYVLDVDYRLAMIEMGL